MPINVSKNTKISFKTLSFIIPAMRGPIWPPMMTPGTAQTKVAVSARPPMHKWNMAARTQTPKIVATLVAIATPIFSDNLLRITGTSHSPMLMLSIPLAIAMVLKIQP
jgi:hypothetical protein